MKPLQIVFQKLMLLMVQFFTQEILSSFPTLHGIPFPNMPTISVSVDGVSILLGNLNIHRATGPDNIPAYVLSII